MRRSLALGAVVLAASALAAPAAEAVTQWPQFRGNPAGTGQAPALGPTRVTGVPGWPVNLGTQVGNVIVGNNGTVYAPAGSRLYALSPSGRTLWAYAAPPGGAFRSAPAVSGGGTVYALATQPAENGTQQIVLLSISPQGQANWQQVVGPSPGTTPNLTRGPDGTLYVPVAPDEAQFFFQGSGGILAAYSGAGAQTWTASLPGTVTAAPSVAPSGASVVVGAGFVAAVAPGGQILWINDDVDGAHSPTVGPDGTVYAATGSGLYALDGQTGSIAWQATIPSASGPSTLSNGNLVYVPTSGGLAGVSTTGAVQFVQDPPGSGLGSTPVNDEAGNLYVASGSAFDALNLGGQTIWTTPTRAAGQSPAMAADGTLYVPDSTLVRAYAGP